MRKKKSRFNVVVSNENGYVIVNTMTAAIIKLNETEWNEFSSEKWSTKMEEILYKQGFIVDNELDEIGLLRNIFRSAQEDKKSARITICPTLECNFACPYCYETRIKGRMSYKVQEKIIENVAELYDKGIELIHFTWYGGEPLLYTEIVSGVSNKLIEVAKEKGRKCTFNIITNGYLINTQVISLFKNIKMNTIQITIDGNEETHNKRRRAIDGSMTFSKIVKNIRELVDNDFSVNIRVNIDKENWNQYDEVKAIFDTYKNVRCYPAFVTEEVIQGKEQKEKCFHHSEYEGVLKEQFIDYNQLCIEEILRPGIGICMAGHRYSFVYAPDGNIYKCINDVCMPQYSIGNVLQNSMEGKPIAIAKYMGRDPFTESECSECEFLPLCYGRCVWEYKAKGSHACPDIKFLLHDIIINKYLACK